MIDLAEFVRPGSGVWWGQAGAEPTPLVHALLDQVGHIGDIRAFVGLTWDARLTDEPPEELHLSSYGALGSLRRLTKQGRVEVIGSTYSALPRLFADGGLPADVGMVQVSPADADGRHSLGIGVDYMADAIESTPVLIAEINERMPVTSGGPRIPTARFAATVHTDRTLMEAPRGLPDDVDDAIAAAVAELIEDGDTVQLGIGALPEAVMAKLGGHRGLGIHSGMISDGVLDLVERGVVTGEHKAIDPGLVVTGAALGSSGLYAVCADTPFRFRPTSYTHSPATLAVLGNLVSVNSAVEVDLLGQVNAEVRRGHYVGAVGGGPDFARAASATGARSIIALRSTSHGHSTIVRTVERVTTSRSDVDAVVTEHGVAWLRGCGEDERARRLVSVAAPQFREGLERALHTQNSAAAAAVRSR
jgi:acyl-CoA hydrolase